MRNRTVLAVIGILISLTASHAQLVRGYGLKIGGVSSMQDWNTQEFHILYDYRWGFQSTAYVEFFELAQFSIVAECEYSQRGSILKVMSTALEFPPYYVVYSDRYDYLSFPLLAKFRLSTSPFDPYLLIGPRIDYLISAQPDKFSEGYYIKMPSSEAGFTVGFGTDITFITPPALLVEIRYNSTFKYSMVNEYARIRWHVFDFLLGVRL